MAAELLSKEIEFLVFCELRRSKWQRSLPIIGRAGSDGSAELVGGASVRPLCRYHFTCPFSVMDLDVGRSHVFRNLSWAAVRQPTIGSDKICPGSSRSKHSLVRKSMMMRKLVACAVCPLANCGGQRCFRTMGKRDTEEISARI